MEYILGIGLFVAGRPNPEGHPIHTTLLEGLYEGENPNLREMIFGQHITMDRGDREWQLRFDAMLVDKGPYF